VTNPPLPSRPGALDRRAVLAGAGALAAALALPLPLLLDAARPAAASVGDPVTATGDVACTGTAVFETMAAVAAWVVPGDDPWSQAQGVTAPTGGGVEAGAPQFLARVLNQVLFDPTAIALILDRLGPQLDTVALPGLNICTRMGSTIEQDGTVALAPLVTAVVNLLATQVRPGSVTGPRPVPFANLTWAEKAEAWRRFEDDIPALFLPELWVLELPLVSGQTGLLETVGGILDYSSGAVIELAGFFAYSEALVFDRAARRLVDRPVGWELSRYLEGWDWPPDGWDELIGYYQGRRAVESSEAVRTDA
jgi:hypothetical protein